MSHASPVLHLMNVTDDGCDGDRITLVVQVQLDHVRGAGALGLPDILEKFVDWLDRFLLIAAPGITRVVKQAVEVVASLRVDLITCPLIEIFRLVTSNVLVQNFSTISGGGPRNIGDVDNFQ